MILIYPVPTFIKYQKIIYFCSQFEGLAVWVLF
jgi:hypothetical protein